MVEPIDRSASAYVQLRVDRLEELTTDSMFYIKPIRPSFRSRLLPWSSFKRDKARFEKLNKELSDWRVAQAHLSMGDGSIAANLIDQDAESLFRTIRQGYYAESIKAMPPYCNVTFDRSSSESVYLNDLMIRSGQAAYRAEVDSGVLGLRHIAQRLRVLTLDDTEKGLTEVRPLTT